VKLGYTSKEYYVAWAEIEDALVTPKGLITGPFESFEQGIRAIEALEPICADRKLFLLGGNMLRVPYQSLTR
jgi:hypothetical protein